MNLEEMRKKLSQELSYVRYQHVLNVEETAIKLAEHYGAPVKKARTAALLHDCAKPLSRKHLLRILEGFDIVVDDTEKSLTPVLHAPVGAIMAEEEYGVDDPDILRAIRYHTIGTPDMRLLDKIIYLADYIEPGRVCSGIDQVRKLAFANIDKAIIKASSNSLVYEIGRDNLIHLNTVKMRNALLERVKKDD